MPLTYAEDEGLALVESIRRVERQALAALPVGVLMQRAANAVANRAEHALRGSPPGSPVLVLAGPGNNGADGLLAGMLLADRGFEVTALAPAPPPAQRDTPLSGLPSAEGPRVRQAWQRRFGTLASPADADTLLARKPIVIDALFGIGLTRPVTGAAASLIADVNRRSLTIIAVDLPSGLDADRGTIVGGDNGVAIRATATVTMIAGKPGLYTGAGRTLSGQVSIASLGITPGPADGHRLTAAFAARHAPVRALDSHKGSHGSVLVVGGAATMQGAALLAAAGAQACGAGKVFLMSPAGPIFDAAQPQWMVRPWAAAAFDGIDAAAVGCGLGTGEPAAALCRRLFESALPLVVDADALNAVSGDPQLRASLAGRRAETILTPHPLEAARLLSASTAEVQRDRIGAAQVLARSFGASTLLKGAGSVIADPDGSWAVVDSGDPTLATAGSGDVLSGMTVALLAQRMPAPLALRLAAWHHGHGGELARRHLPRAVGLSAAELPAFARRSLNAG